MKELNRTDRLNIAATIVMVIIVAGLITLGSPELKYAISSEELLVEATSPEHVIDPRSTDPAASASHFYIDVRNPYEFHKSHIEGAMNVTLHDILDEETLAVFDSVSGAGGTLVLYGTSQLDASSAWMMLRQMGYADSKVMAGGYDFFHDPVAEGKGAEAPGSWDEKPAYDFSKIMEEAGGETVTAKQPEAPETVLPVRKAKKRAVEGGC